MAWNDYNTEVTVTANSNTYTIPVWALDLKVVPWTGNSTYAIELFDGRYKNRIEGYRLVAEFKWAQLKQVDHALFGDMIEDIATEGCATIDFDPNDAPGIRVATFVLTDASNIINAIFEGRVRMRPGVMAFISKIVYSTVPAWVTGIPPHWNTLVIQRDSLATTSRSALYVDRTTAETVASHSLTTGNGITNFAFAFDNEGQHLFEMTTNSGKEIRRYDYITGANNTQILSGLGSGLSPYQMEWNPADSKLYWHNRTNEEVQRCDFDGSNFDVTWMDTSAIGTANLARQVLMIIGGDIWVSGGDGTPEKSLYRKAAGSGAFASGDLVMTDSVFESNEIREAHYDPIDNAIFYYGADNAGDMYIRKYDIDTDTQSTITQPTTSTDPIRGLAVSYDDGYLYWAQEDTGIFRTLKSGLGSDELWFEGEVGVNYIYGGLALITV